METRYSMRLSFVGRKRRLYFGHLDQRGEQFALTAFTRRPEPQFSSQVFGTEYSYSDGLQGRHHFLLGYEVPPLESW